MRRDRDATFPSHCTKKEKQLDGVVYAGQALPLFPDLSEQVRLFTGVREDLLHAAKIDPNTALSLSLKASKVGSAREAQSALPYRSTTASGLCMEIEGLF